MTLRELVEDVLRRNQGCDTADERDVATVADEVVAAVAAWLESDDVRPVIYDGMVDVGPTTKNIGIALAQHARANDPDGYTRSEESGANDDR